ncbi:MAG: radical SAM protein, partial [Flavobacterium sp.]|nr:radical SAM protein [Flavobacterium sp.]
NINKWPLEHWHIEISSKCSLRCPRCTRQEVPEGLINTQLTLPWFEKNFTNILPYTKKITFCGDDGDPIYAKDFLQVLSYIREHNKLTQFVIVTNGSYKTKTWWRKLATILNEKDHVHFSIDGWDQDSNNIYRVNCNWNSIMDGIKSFKELNSEPATTWAAIAFKFNEHKITHLKGLAKKLKFDYFQLTHSSKFGSNYSAYPKDDPLEPSKKYVSEGRFTRTIEHLSKKEWKDSCKNIFDSRLNTVKPIGNVQPLCHVCNKGLYLNSQGKFFPCCCVGLRYAHTRNLLNYVYQNNRTLDEILDDENWQLLWSSMLDGSCPSECSVKCNTNKWNHEHVTQW